LAFWAVSLSTMKLIRSLADFGKLVGPLDHPVLYLRY
jgi:hypothetical protein